MTVYLSAVPAYGRSYKSAKAVRADWAAGLDFRIEDRRESGYVSKHDLSAGTVLEIRFGCGLEKVCVIR